MPPEPGFQVNKFQVSTPASVAAAAAARSTSTTTPSPATSNTTAVNQNAHNPVATNNLSLETQLLLNRISASSSLAGVQGTPEWEAARSSILKSMAGNDSAFATPNRPHNMDSPSRSDSLSVAQSVPSPRSETITMASTAERPGPNPSTRGRGGHGRGARGAAIRGGRGGTGSGRGRPKGSTKKKRKRRNSDEEDDGNDDDDDSDVSNSYTPLPSTTRSGRSVTKPQAFIPAPPTDSPTSSTPIRGGRTANGGAVSSRRGLPKQYSSNVNTSRIRSHTGFSPDTIVCSRCLRAHSPPSNPIVFCDGCDTSYHQWCHYPPISRETVLLPDKEWFCGDCEERKEMATTPNETRVPANIEGLTEQEQARYLEGVPHKTLVTLLLSAVKINPSLKVFAPNTRHLVQTVLNPNYTAPRGAVANGMNGSHASSAAGANDNYSDWNNPYGDPPATYNRPSQGQIPLTNVAKTPWLVDNDSDAFSHLVNDGPDGELVKLDRSKGDWVRFHDAGGGFGLFDRPENRKEKPDATNGANGSASHESAAHGDAEEKMTVETNGNGQLAAAETEDDTAKDGEQAVAGFMEE